MIQSSTQKARSAGASNTHGPLTKTAPLEGADMATESVDGKVCTRCLAYKPLADYYGAKIGRLGRKSICRACMRIARRARYATPVETAKRDANRDRTREMDRLYSARNRAKYPERTRARNMLGYAVKRGCIVPPETPGHEWYSKLEFHHVDYSRPYYGCWVTRKQHRRIESGEEMTPPPVDYGPQVARWVINHFQLSITDLAAARAVHKGAERGE